MPFGVVSAVGLGMGVLDFGGDRRRERAVYGGVVNLGRPIVGLTNGAFATRSSQITLRTCYHSAPRRTHYFYFPRDATLAR